MSYIFNPFTATMDRVVKTVAAVANYIDTIFLTDISIPITKVLILKDPIISANIIADGELYLL